MENKNLGLQVQEQVVKALTMIKIMGCLSMITKKEYDRAFEKVKENEFYSEAVENLADIAATQVLALMNSKLKLGEKYDIKFNQNLIVWSNTYYTVKNCDVIVISEDNIHAMQIISTDYDFIEVDQCEEMFLIGYGVLDKFLHKTKSKTIDLTIIQPNLQTSSSCTVLAQNIFDEYEKNSES